MFLIFHRKNIVKGFEFSVLQIKLLKGSQEKITLELFKFYKTLQILN